MGIESSVLKHRSALSSRDNFHHKTPVLFCPKSISSPENYCASTSMERNPNKPTKSWSDVPRELLSCIADTLGLIDLLSFRGVCKDWRSAASSTATAKIESVPFAKPYFLLHTIDGNCKFWDQEDDKTYSINIPELKDATFLASKQGWLLLSQNGSLFFFCPFSRARVDLPEFPHSDMSNHVGAFSHPPTSPNCIVSILDHKDKPNMELNILSRAAGDTWTKYVYTRTRGTYRITSAIYCDGAFCFEDDCSRGFSFSVGEKKWEIYTIGHGSGHAEKMMPYSFTKHYSNRGKLRQWLKVEDDVSVLACGAILSYAKHDHAICNELLPGSKGSEGTTLRGVWIQPRFYARSSDPTWFIQS